MVIEGLAFCAFQFSMTFLIGLLLAGLAGSCVSVMPRMPMLEITLVRRACGIPAANC